MNANLNTFRRTTIAPNAVCTTVNYNLISNEDGCALYEMPAPSVIGDATLISKSRIDPFTTPEGAIVGYYVVAMTEINPICWSTPEQAATAWADRVLVESAVRRQTTA
tara:strand:+ start:1227 stop:1550 length:324 start_codon:yes stop_codon:yes gene_type:complete